MTTNDKDIYAQIAGAKAQRVSNPTRNGHYLIRVNACRKGEAFKKGTFFVVEKTILHVFPDSVGGFDYDRKMPVPVHAVGDDPSDVIMASNVAFEGRVKAFVMAAGDVPEAQVTPAMIRDVFGDDQPAAGLVLEIRAATRVKKEAKSKAENELTNKDIYTQIDYVRVLKFAEVKQILPADVAARLMPDLDAEVANESAPAPAQG